MSNITDRGNRDAGFGANRTKRSGDRKEQGPHGAGKSAGTIPQRGGEIPATRVKPRNTSKDNLTPRWADVANEKTAERGGHSRDGHGRFNPTAGKSKSGSKASQHPANRKGR